MKTLAKALGAVLVLASAQAAWAQTGPNWMGFSGRLSDNGAPVTGTHNLTFRLFNSATGGTALWTEDQTGVAFDDGMVFLQLGSTVSNDLDVAFFEDGGQLYLEIVLDGTAMTPRLGIGMVPFAKFADKAGDAATLAGMAPASFLQQPASACSTDQVLKWNGSAWACGDDQAGAGSTAINTPAGSGLTGGGGSSPFSLALQACSNGQVLKHNGSSWACAADDSGTGGSVTAGAGIDVSGSTVSLDSTGCSSGYVLKSDGAGGWSCTTDDVGSGGTTYTAGSGINIASSTISIASAGCSAGEVLRWSGSAWACGADRYTYVNSGSGCPAGHTALAYRLSSTTCTGTPDDCGSGCSGSSCTIPATPWSGSAGTPGTCIYRNAVDLNCCDSCGYGPDRTCTQSGAQTLCATP